MRDGLLRDAVIGVSVATACMHRMWRALLSSWPQMPSHCRTDYLAGIIDLLLVGSGLALVLALRRRGGPWKLLALIPLVATAMQADLFRTLAVSSIRTLPRLASPLNTIGVLLAALMAAVLFAGFFTRKRDLLVRAAETVFVVTAPIGALVIAELGWRAITTPAVANYRSITTPQNKLADGPRVLILVFDELDQRILFEERPAGMHFPQFDRFRAHSIYANHVQQIAPSTLEAIPGMLSGNSFAGYRFSLHNLLLQKTRDDQFLLWRQTPNLFQDAADHNVPAAISGWYLPYCTAFGTLVAECRSYPTHGMPTHGDSLLHAVTGQLPTASPTNHSTRMADNYCSIRKDALEFATRRDLRLALVHWPIPHVPGIYDTSSGRVKPMVLRGVQRQYVDNLVLTDRTLGELRQAMEQAGVWESTTVLVTSDHGWRAAAHPDHRVPFLLKVARQTTPAVFDGVVENTLIHDLALGCLRSEIVTVDDAVRWMEARARHNQATSISDH